MGLAVNGIVNVLNSTIDSEISGSTIIASGDTNINSTYDTTIQGITAVGAVALSSSNTVGGNNNSKCCQK